MKERILVALFVAALLAGVARGSHHSAPTKLAVPGERYHVVKQSTLGSTVCVHGFTATIRPPESYTSALKRWLLRDRNLPGSVSDYQLDHAISLELGGAPYSTRNLWMEAQPQARRTDSYENELHAKLCSGQLTLRTAQRMEIAFKKANG